MCLFFKKENLWMYKVYLKVKVSKVLLNATDNLADLCLMVLVITVGPV